ncbi:MAG: alpha/beta hydrolase [Bacteroidota bacterium]
MKLRLLLITAFVTTGFTTTVQGLNPSAEYKVKPEKYGMTYKEERIATKDGAMLNAWFFETPKGKTTNWLVVSGSGDGNMADNIEIASQFLSIGWNVVLYDYRGYGASSAFAIDPETYIYPQFLEDLKAVLDHLRKSRAITKFDLYGQNIGAGISIGVGCNRMETRKIIADGPWNGLENMKKRIKEKQGKDVIIPFGFDKSYEPMYACDKSRPHLKGVMLIVSAKDEMISPLDMKPLVCKTNVYVVQESNSNAENFSADKNMYFEKVQKFLLN